MGQIIHLQVFDLRVEKTLLGRGGAIVRSYLLDRPATEVVEDSFMEAYSHAGYRFSSDSDVVLKVFIKDFSTIYARTESVMFNQWIARVKFQIVIVRNGVTVRTRYIYAEANEDEAMSRAYASGGMGWISLGIERAASEALSSAIEESLTDKDIVRAINPRGVPQVGLAGPVPSASRPSGLRYDALYHRRVATVVGINEYAHWPRLEGAVSDASRVAESLRNRGFDEVIEIYDGDATREQILWQLGVDLPARTGKEDLVVIYFAGHGQTETLPNGEKRGYVIPVESPVDDPFASAISMAQLRSLSNRIPAKHVYYVMDSCYSGLGLVRGIRAVQKTSDYVQQVTSYRAIQMITAGQEGEVVSERGGRGIFTTYWLRALDGEADFDGDGYVTANEIGAYVPSEVSNITRRRQTPLFGTLEGRGQVVFKVR
jgi:hypothetical protein